MKNFVQTAVLWSIMPVGILGLVLLNSALDSSQKPPMPVAARVLTADTTPVVTDQPPGLVSISIMPIARSAQPKNRPLHIRCLPARADAFAGLRRVNGMDPFRRSIPRDRR